MAPMAAPLQEREVDPASVLIIGAGCSRAISDMVGFGPMPLMADFMQKAHALTITAQGVYESDFRPLWEFVGDYFKIGRSSTNPALLDSAQLPQVNVEDAMSVLDFAAQRSDGLGVRRSYDARVLSDSMKVMIYRTIASQSPFQQTATSLQQLAQANDLVTQILRKSGAANIICFNWDILFDSTMVRFDPLRLWDWDHSYGYTPSLYFQGHRDFGQRRGDVILRMRLLKPHGSMNWGICHACSTSYIYDHSDLQQLYSAAYSPPAMTRCHRCQAKLSLALIPPTWEKRVDEWPFNAIWRRAFVSLVAARHVTVIGYALAAGDFLVRNLLITSRAANPNKVELTIVDPAVAKPDSELEKNWRRAFHPDVVSLKASLTDFLA